jgi:outer membrane murein-binding lipoprotein Lpp
MKLTPYRCVACGNTGEQKGGPPTAYFAEGADINWGDSLYLCESCVNVLGQLAGMVSEEQHDLVKTRLEHLQAKYEELTQEHDRQNERVDRMLDGVKAKKEATQVRQRRSSRKKEVV